MDWILPAVIATLTSSIILALVYLHLYSQEKEKHLKSWAASWCIYSFRFLLMLAFLLWERNPVFLAGNQLCSLWASYLLLRGVHQFSNHSSSHWWLIGSLLGSAWILSSVFFQISFLWLALPTFSFMALVNIRAGIAFLNQKVPLGMGTRVVAWTFIVWGLHKADYPFLQPVAWFAPWGYLLGAILALITAIGILLVYFQKSRDDLLQSEQRFRQLAEHIKNVFWVGSPDWQQVHYVSPAYREIWRREPEELYRNPTSWMDSVHPDDRQQVISKIEALAGTNFAPGSFEPYRIVRSDGAISWIEARYFPVTGKGGQIERVVGIATDITTRKNAEDALLSSERRLLEITEASHTFAWEVNAEGLYTYMSHYAEGLVGYPMKELVGRKHFYDLHPEIGRDKFKAAAFEFFQRKGKFQDYQNPIETKDGSLIWVSTCGLPVLGENGELLGYRGSDRNITERRRRDDLQAAQIRLINFAAGHSSTELLQNFLDEAERLTGSEIGSFRFVEDDPKKPCLQVWSSNTLSNMCSDQGEVLHYPISEAGVWVDCVRERQPVIHNDDASLPHKKGLPDGRAEVIRELVVPVTRKGKTVAVFGVGNKRNDYNKHDVETLQHLAEFAWETIARKMAEEKIERNEQFLDAVIENIPNMISIKDAKDLKYVRLNKAGEYLMGVPREKLMGKTDRDLLQAEQAELSSARDHQVLESGVLLDIPEEELLSETKGKRLLHTRKLPLVGENGRPQYLLGISEDITELKQAEEQLRQAQKMEAIGTLAGGIAHDFNNILAAITGYSELALDDALDGRSPREDIEQILKAAARAKKLIQQILAFSRKAASEQKPLNLNRVIAQTISLIERTIPRMISVETHLAPDLHPVKGDPNQMEQVLLNLANNAQDAMPEGGKLIIETSLVSLDEANADAHFGATRGDYVRVTISDTGDGMEKEVLEHMFDPFYTTKEVGKGTGLGLASVYGIVKSHGGHITCHSEPGQGSTFMIYLPTLEFSEETRESREAAGNHEPEGTETILLVDDEEPLRKIGSRILEKKGYRLITANNGEEAVKIYQEKLSLIDLVILDISMPGMGGHKCLKEILRQNPQAKVIIASGYALSGLAQDALQIGADKYIAKPFEMTALLKTVREVLDR